MRVLLVEDDSSTAKSIELMLKSEGYIIDTTDLGEEGIDLGRIYDYDIIVLDLMLPDMDGYAVMQCLREKETTRDIPVVAISANAMPKDLARGKAAGFVEYLTKPLDVDKLLQVVDDVIVKRMDSAPGN